MFELTLSTTIDKQIYLSQLFSKLSGEIRQDAGVIAKQNNSGRAYLLVAVDENKKEYYKAKVLEHILFMVTDDYKFNFYKENILPNEDSEVFLAFLKAITIFDAENDKEIIQSQIQLSNEFLVDSFFYFKLGLLRARWQKTADIINQNKITSSEQAIIDVLKYLLAVAENDVVSVSVSFSKKRISLFNCCQNKTFKTDFSGKSNFFAEIIRLNPAKINVKVSKGCEYADDVKGKLTRIFGEKIYLINWF